MSRIGKLPVPVPSGVDVAIEGPVVTVKGPKGTLSHTVAAPITVGRGDDGAIQVVRPDDERESKSLPTSVRSANPSRTRARAFATPASKFDARPARPASKDATQ